MKNIIFPLLLATTVLFAESNHLNETLPMDFPDKSTSTNVTAKKDDVGKSNETLETEEETIDFPSNKAFRTKISSNADVEIDGVSFIKHARKEMIYGAQKESIKKLFFKDFDFKNLLSASFVSRNKKGEVVRGKGASPSIMKLSDSEEELEVMFMFEIKYKLEWYYAKYLPALTKLFDQAAILKHEQSISINLLNKHSKEKRFIQPTQTSSFPVISNMYLHQHSQDLYFANWKKRIQSREESIFLACNLGRDHLGKNQRFSIYELPSALFLGMLNDSPIRIIPPITLELKDHNGTIIRQEQWHPRQVLASGSPGSETDESWLKPLGYSNAKHLYTKFPASYRNPIPTGLMKKNSIGRTPCFIIAPWFIYESGNSNVSFYTDAPVITKTLMMSPRDLEMIRRISINF
jgi:hypothetical protein